MFFGTWIRDRVLFSLLEQVKRKMTRHFADYKICSCPLPSMIYLLHKNKKHKSKLRKMQKSAAYPVDENSR
jgi:hypothetical protein